MALDPKRRQKFQSPSSSDWHQAFATAAIKAGDVVRVSGTTDGGAYFSIAPALGDGTNDGPVGVAATQASAGDRVWFKWSGLIDLDTSSATKGDPVYLSDTVAGAVTLTPTAEAVAEVAFVASSGAAYLTSASKGLVSLSQGNTLFVDAVFGDDATALRNRQDRPYATAQAAIAASVTGDLISLAPGTYEEEGLTLPADVHLRGSGWLATTLGKASATSTIVTFSGSVIEGLTVQAPSGSGLRGLAHTSGTGGVYSCNVSGSPGGSGDGIYKTGSGKLIGGNIRCEAGGLNSTFRVDSGVLALDDVHGPGVPDAVAVFLLAEGTGRYQGQGFNVGNPNCTDAVKLLGTSQVLLYSPNIFNVATAIHIAADGVEFISTGGKIQAATYTYEVDLALTGVGTRVESLSTVLEPLFFFPPVAAENVDFVLSFDQLRTNVREAQRREIGHDVALGFPEKGSGLYVGKGSSYGDGIIVVTSDSTASSTLVGGNLTNVTAAAQSLDSSTFSFQGTTANHCIYFASGRLDSSSNPIKHWGALFDQVTAGVGGSYVAEIWDGAAWTEVGVLAVAQELGHRYGNALFLRASSQEDLRYGIKDSTTWVASAVGAFGTYYWVRIRIDSAPSVLPTWERWWLTESTLHVNRKGQITADGLAQWKQTLVGAGNVFASGGSTTQGSSTVGTGGGTWTHNLDNAKLNQTGDSITTQFVIPDGVNTAYPIKFRVHYQFAQYSSAPTLTGGILGVEREGVLVADLSGGIPPVARTVANTAALTDRAGQTAAVVPTATDTNKILLLEYGPYSLADFYAGDLVLFFLELTSDGGGGLATDVQIWAIEVEGITFAVGDLV